MLNTIVAGVVILVMTVLIGFPVALFVFCRRMSARFRVASSSRERAAIVAAILGFLASPLIAFECISYAWYNSWMPTEARPSLITFKAEKSLGIGPGGNETGFIVYRIFGDTTPHGAEWLNTPVRDRDPDHKRDWHAYDGDETTCAPCTLHGPILGEYLRQYGGWLTIPSELENDFNDSIRRPGSYYQYQSGGAIVVISPKKHRAFVAYAG